MCCSGGLWSDRFSGANKHPNMQEALLNNGIFTISVSGYNSPAQWLLLINVVFSWVKLTCKICFAKTENSTSVLTALSTDSTISSEETESEMLARLETTLPNDGESAVAN